MALCVLFQLADITFFRTAEFRRFISERLNSAVLSPLLLFFKCFFPSFGRFQKCIVFLFSLNSSVLIFSFDFNFHSRI